MTASQPDPMLGRLIDGRYQVRSRIARGGMATVYLATDLRLERRVAIKVMHGHLADDAQFKNRFVQEARSAARLAHPNVVSVFDQGQDADMAYLVMEYLPGITLRDLLRDYGRLTPEQTIDITDAVLSGLAAAHRAGIVHRDLKPENVLLADDGRIKIGDFGLARAVTNSTGTGQALLGTIAYLSPELVTRGVADARSDIYALGIMMFEMLTGEQPFKGEQPMQVAYQHANDAVPRPSRLNPDVPPQLDDLVLWATAKDPAARPADAGVMLERLLQTERELHTPGSDTGPQPTLVLAGGGVEASDSDTQLIGPAAQVRPEASATDAVAALAKTAHGRQSRGWWLLALVLVLAAVAGGTGWYFGGGPGSQVAVPSVNGTTLDAAKTALTKSGFKIATDEVYSSSVPAGSVVSSTPGQGAKATNGSTVKLHVSKGRQPITIPALAGLSKAQAQKAITDAGAVVGTVDEQFVSDAPKDTVVSAAQAEGDKADLSKGGGYFKGLKVNLLVSLGAVPDVTGKPESDAEAALTAVGLKYAEGKKDYSDSVSKGSVLSQAPQNEGPVRVGDTIVLDISLGPAPVAVPNVVGETWDKAKKDLTDAGFKVSYPATVGPIPVDQFPSAFKVTATDPAASTMQPKGSTVTVSLSFGG
ncbi:Stk1 family PASTA domain-containing Ser/Thr kinase [Humibacter antri]